MKFRHKITASAVLVLAAAAARKLPAGGQHDDLPPPDWTQVAEWAACRARVVVRRQVRGLLTRAGVPVPSVAAHRSEPERLTGAQAVVQCQARRTDPWDDNW